MKDYFSHDYQARNDRKLINLRMRHGMAGIGVYWCIVEMLYEEKGFVMLAQCDCIAFELQTQSDLVKSIITEFDLFNNDGEKFWSESTLNRLKIREEKIEKARLNGGKRWKNREIKNLNSDGNAKAMRTLSKGNAIKDKYKDIITPLPPFLGGLEKKVNPEPETEKSSSKPEENYLTKRDRKLTGPRLTKFLEFWRVFAYPEGKANAADVWLDIKNLDEIYPKIIAGAKAEARRRPEIKAKGQTPKMAQGWLSGRRWEDFTESIKPGRIINMEKPTPTRCAACGKDAAIMDLESGLCRPCFTGKTPAETKRDIENLVHAIGGAA